MHQTCCLAFLSRYLNMSNIISLPSIYLNRQMKMNRAVLTSVSFLVSNRGCFVCVFSWMCGYLLISVFLDQWVLPASCILNS